jgi:fused signal recognition particle receptor
VTGRSLSEETLESLEEALIGADIGIDATTEIIRGVAQDPQRILADAAWAVQAVRTRIQRILEDVSVPFELVPDAPTVVLVVGVNGVGKTTTVGKLAAHFARDGKKVIIGSADTFRAAADEQLSVWAERAQATVVRHERGADAASVAYDSVAAAKSRNADVVLIDTAGRLHTKSNLMEELKKIRRVLTKLDPRFPHHILLVVDATSGQNALVQARQFSEAMGGITGIALTKLDSSAHGGIIVAIAETLHVPVQFIGVGEGLDDLQHFDAGAFVEALFDGGEA